MVSFLLLLLCPIIKTILWSLLLKIIVVIAASEFREGKFCTNAEFSEKDVDVLYWNFQCWCLADLEGKWGWKSWLNGKIDGCWVSFCLLLSICYLNWSPKSARNCSRSYKLPKKLFQNFCFIHEFSIMFIEFSHSPNLQRNTSFITIFSFPILSLQIFNFRRKKLTNWNFSFIDVIFVISTYVCYKKIN